MNNKYKRESTTTTVSIFYEQYQLNKYNFDPPYQRDYNVWGEDQKSFFLDTIFKNFPCPPIFLQQNIDQKTGKTNYDVIDGKQRLTTIINFINGEVKLPLTFSKDEYGKKNMDGLSFIDLQELSNKDIEVADYISIFWSYVLSIEYIENPDVKVVNSIFDRLNRGGSNLNPIELRRANYYDTLLYKSVESLREKEFFRVMLSSCNKDRLIDIGFITEIFLMILLDKILEGSEEKIDDYFETQVDKITIEKNQEILDTLDEMEKIIEVFCLDYKKYTIQGVSHLYAIFYLAYFIDKHNVNNYVNLIDKLNLFYKDLRKDKSDTNVQLYHSSMQSASRSKSSRKKRVKALLDYLGLKYEVNDF